MKAVYSAANITLVSIYRDLLERNGIKCWIRNEFLPRGASLTPPYADWPQLCVDDDDYLEAKRIVEEGLSSDNPDLKAWKCPSCGEENEGQFSECWNCGKPRRE